MNINRILSLSGVPTLNIDESYDIDEADRYYTNQDEVHDKDNLISVDEVYDIIHHHKIETPAAYGLDSGMKEYFQYYCADQNAILNSELVSLYETCVNLENSVEGGFEFDSNAKLKVEKLVNETIGQVSYEPRMDVNSFANGIKQVISLFELLQSEYEPYKSEEDYAGVLASANKTVHTDKFGDQYISRDGEI